MALSVALTRLPLRGQRRDRGGCVGQTRPHRLELLVEGSSLRGKIEAQGAKLLPLAADCQLHLPARIGDYTDFYVGIEQLSCLIIAWAA